MRAVEDTGPIHPGDNICISDLKDIRKKNSRAKTYLSPYTLSPFIRLLNVLFAKNTVVSNSHCSICL